MDVRLQELSLCAWTKGHRVEILLQEVFRSSQGEGHVLPWRIRVFRTLQWLCAQIFQEKM